MLSSFSTLLPPLFNSIFLYFAHASSCRLSRWPARQCTWFSMSSAVLLSRYSSALFWADVHSLSSVSNSSLIFFDTFLISYCCIHVHQCFHDTQSFFLAILHLLLPTSFLSSTWKIFIKEYQHCSSCFGECLLVPCLLSLQFFNLLHDISSYIATCVINRCLRHSQHLFSYSCYLLQLFTIQYTRNSWYGCIVIYKITTIIISICIWHCCWLMQPSSATKKCSGRNSEFLNNTIKYLFLLI